MNKKILLFGLLLVIPFVFALKGEIEGDFYVDGNMGIGTSTPTDKLHVVGGVTIDDPDAQIEFYGENGMKWTVGTTGGAGDNFIIYDRDSNSTRITINASNGNVGIGTSTPSYPLQVGAFATNGISIYALGNVSAEYYIDRSYFPNRDVDALSTIMGIKSDGSNKLDHSTLPDIAKGNIEKPVYDEKGSVISTETIEGRNLGVMSGLNTKAIQELNTEIEYLKSELCKKDQTYEFCKV